MQRSLDVIIPVFNEEAILHSLIERLRTVFSVQTLLAFKLDAVRIMFVDDGSTDGTAKLIAEKIDHGWNAKLVCLSRNFGHQAALAAGMDHSTADFIVIMDADLQDPPELLLDMVKRLDEGFDIVYGQRRSRQEPFYKKILYSAFYRLCSFLSEVRMPVDAGDFCMMRRDVLAAIQKLPEKLRFHRGLRSWIGFKQSALPFDRPLRELGDSKYSWAMLYALGTDGIASMSIRPLRITQVFLFLSVLVTLLFFGVASFLYFHSARTDVHILWFLATQGLIAFTSSLQLFSLYILGAYLGRMYLEVKARPSYVVMKTLEPSPIKPL